MLLRRRVKYGVPYYVVSSSRLWHAPCMRVGKSSQCLDPGICSAGGLLVLHRNNRHGRQQYLILLADCMYVPSRIDAISYLYINPIADTQNVKYDTVYRILFPVPYIDSSITQYDCMFASEVLTYNTLSMNGLSPRIYLQMRNYIPSHLILTPYSLTYILTQCSFSTCRWLPSRPPQPHATWNARNS